MFFVRKIMFWCDLFVISCYICGGKIKKRMSYNIIYADPAWSYNDKSLHRGVAERHYSTMSEAEIMDLPISEISAENSILFMWATFPKMQEALNVIKACGFEYKTVGFVWIKTNKREKTSQLSFLPKDSFDSFWGMGRWTRNNAEVCLIGTKGSPKREKADVHSVIYEPIDTHSKNPPIVRDNIVRLCGDLPRVELFARQTAQGWDSWGNEVSNSIVL